MHSASMLVFQTCSNISNKRRKAELDFQSQPMIAELLLPMVLEKELEPSSSRHIPERILDLRLKQGMMEQK